MGVEQAIEFAAAPARDDVNPNVEHGRNCTQRVKRHRADVPALDE